MFGGFGVWFLACCVMCVAMWFTSSAGCSLRWMVPMWCGIWASCVCVGIGLWMLRLVG